MVFVFVKKFKIGEMVIVWVMVVVVVVMVFEMG